MHVYIDSDRRPAPIRQKGRITFPLSSCQTQPLHHRTLRSCTRPPITSPVLPCKSGLLRLPAKRRDGLVKKRGNLPAKQHGDFSVMPRKWSIHVEKTACARRSFREFPCPLEFTYSARRRAAQSVRWTKVTPTR